MEGIGILVTQQIRNLIDAPVSSKQQLTPEVPARLRQQGTKGRAFLGDSTLQGALAHSQIARNV